MNYAEIVKEAIERRLFLPNIQRGVVWDEDDICALVDSILRGYPIGAFFIWNTTLANVVFRTFADSYNSSDFLPHLQQISDQEKVKLVLDGQQRIQAMLIALRGRYNGKQCCIRIAPPKNNSTNPDDLAYDIEFLTETELTERQADDRNWCTIGQLYYHPNDVIRDLESSENSDSDLRPLINKLKEQFDTQAKIIEVGPDRPLHEVVNIFIRVNKAGEPLKAADLIMALVKTEWNTAGEMFERLSRELDYDVDSTFVLRWALTYLGQGINLRDIAKVSSFANEIRDNFGEISKIAKTSVAFAKEAVEKRRGLVGTAGFALLPVLYYAKLDFPLDTEINKARIRYWLYWSHLIGRFSFRGINKVPKVQEAIDINKGPNLPIEAMISAIIEHYPHVQPKVDLRKPEGILEIAKHNVGAILKIYQRKRVSEAGSLSSYHVDHIFPQKRLEEKGFTSEQINDIGNLRLYLGILNERKNAQDPTDHIRDKSEGELKDEFGLDDRDLFRYDKYMEFVEKRREVLLASVASYLAYK